nr:hypothetical protein [Pseudoroseomonas ludipueritiae]
MSDRPANAPASALPSTLPKASLAGAAAALTGDALDLAIKGLAEAVEEEIGHEPFHLGTIAPQARKPKPPPTHRPSRVRLDDPAEAAAHAMLRRLLLADPSLRLRALEPGAVIVVEVPDAEWVDPVAETWRMLIHGTDEIPFDGDDDQERPYRRLSTVEPKWAEFRRDGSARRHRPEDGNGAVRTMVASGRPVYGFSPAPARCLPSDLLRVATATVTVGPLDPTALAEAATMLTSVAPVTASVPAEVAPLVTVGDLWLARLPNQDADDYLRRLAELASQRIAARPLTLDGLHGMGEASALGQGRSARPRRLRQRRAAVARRGPRRRAGRPHRHRQDHLRQGARRAVRGAARDRLSRPVAGRQGRPSRHDARRHARDLRGRAQGGALRPAGGRDRRLRRRNRQPKAALC